MANMMLSDTIFDLFFNASNIIRRQKVIVYTYVSACPDRSMMWAKVEYNIIETKILFRSIFSSLHILYINRLLNEKRIDEKMAKRAT